MAEKGTPIFTELIRDKYIYPGQAFSIQWFGVHTFFGMVTDDGRLQLTSKPFLSNTTTTSPAAATPPTTNGGGGALVSWSEQAMNNEEDEPCLDLQTLDDLQQQLCTLEVKLGEKFRAPSTVTEHCYQKMQGMPIIWPRNAEEKEQQVYQLDPKRVRHNGWGKVCFLYKSHSMPTIITLAANKLRSPEGRADFQRQHVVPLPFRCVANMLLPLDDLDVAEHMLTRSLPPDQLGYSLQLLHALRSQHHLSSAAIIALLIGKQSQVQQGLEAIQGGEQVMGMYLQERNHMIEQRLRHTSSDPLLLSSHPDSSSSSSSSNTLAPPPSLPDSLLSELSTPTAATTQTAPLLSMGIGVDEILACSDLGLDTPPPPAATASPPIEEGVLRTQRWCDVFDVYQKIVQSYQVAQPQQSTAAATNHAGFYRSVCSYQQSDSHSNLLQSFYRYIDDCYDGDGDRMKQDLMNYVFDLYSQLLERSPRSLDECGGDMDLHWNYTLSPSEHDPERNALIQHFHHMSNLITFVDAALEERNHAASPQEEQPQPVVTSPPPLQDSSDDIPAGGKVVDELSYSYKTTETRELQNPNSDKERLQVHEVRLIITHTRIESVPKKRPLLQTKRVVEQHRKRVRSVV